MNRLGGVLVSVGVLRHTLFHSGDLFRGRFTLMLLLPLGKGHAVDDGAGLVDKSLGGEAPLLAINARSTVSQKSEQSGFANLVKGAFGMFRNPTAHEARIHWTMTKDDAEDLLTIVSLIHRRLDAAHRRPCP